MDFIIVMFSIIDMSLSGQNLGFIKIVRMLRILRPLRFISNNPSLKILVNCLLESVGGLMNVILVILLIWYKINNIHIKPLLSPNNPPSQDDVRNPVHKPAFRQLGLLLRNRSNFSVQHKPGRLP